MFPESNRPFADRREAGTELAAKLKRYAGRDDVVVLAPPRGGVPVAFMVAEELDAELDIFMVRKLGMPGYREYAIGPSHSAACACSANTWCARIPCRRKRSRPLRA